MRVSAGFITGVVETDGVERPTGLTGSHWGLFQPGDSFTPVSLCLPPFFFLFLLSSSLLAQRLLAMGVSKEFSQLEGDRSRIMTAMKGFLRRFA